MKFEIDDAKMDEATKKKLVDCVGLLGLSRIVEPTNTNDSGYVAISEIGADRIKKYLFNVFGLREKQLSIID